MDNTYLVTLSMPPLSARPSLSVFRDRAAAVACYDRLRAQLVLLRQGWLELNWLEESDGVGQDSGSNVPFRMRSFDGQTQEEVSR